VGFVFAIVLAIVAASCGPGDVIGTGDALSAAGGATFGGAVAFPPGSRMGFLMLYLHNVSDDPIELVGIGLSGQGLGRTVRVVKIEVSPNLGHLGGIHGIPGGAYVTDPPVNLLDDGKCHRPVLRPVEGFTLQPGAEARAWVVLEWGEPGRFLLGPHEVLYLRDGSLYRQTLELFYRGVVDPRAKLPRIESWERPCLAKTRLLNPSSVAA
jgi:hypothetical protein